MERDFKSFYRLSFSWWYFHQVLSYQWEQDDSFGAPASKVCLLMDLIDTMHCHHNCLGCRIKGNWSLRSWSEPNFGPHWSLECMYLVLISPELPSKITSDSGIRGNLADSDAVQVSWRYIVFFVGWVIFSFDQGAYIIPDLDWFPLHPLELQHRFPVIGPFCG